MVATMSVSVLELDEEVGTNQPASELSDIYDHFLADGSLPVPEWLTRLQLDTPRRSTRCMSEWTRAGKRLIDVVGASILLALLIPVMLLTAVAVWLTSPGPVIFRQTRVGLNERKRSPDRRKHQIDSDQMPFEDRRNPGSNRRRESGYGRPFVLYKFRTMRNDAEKAGAQFAAKNDPRVTSIGRFMRKTRLDELPQLWNVLKGEMSLVGPRPERPEFIGKLNEEIPNYINRLGLKPGLTGIAQIVNGYDNDIEGFRRKVSYDLMYLQNCCLWNDIKILFRTIRVVLSGSGAL